MNDWEKNKKCQRIRVLVKFCQRWLKNFPVASVHSKTDEFFVMNNAVRSSTTTEY